MGLFSTEATHYYTWLQSIYVRWWLLNESHKAPFHRLKLLFQKKTATVRRHVAKKRFIGFRRTTAKWICNTIMYSRGTVGVARLGASLYVGGDWSAMEPRAREMGTWTLSSVFERRLYGYLKPYVTVFLRFFTVQLRWIETIESICVWFCCGTSWGCTGYAISDGCLTWGKYQNQVTCNAAVLQLYVGTYTF